MNACYDKVPVIIPALNPDNRIRIFIHSLEEVGFDNIIVVDDGSDSHHKEGIFRELEEEGIKVLSYDDNQGKGAAIKDGLSYVYDDIPDAIGAVTADCDGRQSAKAATLIADKLLEGKEFVLGTRDLDNSPISDKMRRGYKIVELAFRILYSKRIKDIQTGLRGIARSLMPHFIEIKGSRYEYEPKMIIESVRDDIHIYEVEVGPIKPIDMDDSTIMRSENFRPFADSFRIVVVLFINFIKYAMTSISATAVDFALFYTLSNYVLKDLSLGMCVLLSTVIARVVSSTLAFLVNRNVVFKSKDNLVKKMLKFYGLAAIIMFCSAELVTLFVYLFGGGKTFTKLFVDLCLFFISYQIQQRFIFNTREK